MLGIPSVLGRDTMASLFRPHRLLPVSCPISQSGALTVVTGGWTFIAEIVGNARKLATENGLPAVCVDVKDADGKLIQLTMLRCPGDPTRLKEMKRKHTIYAPIALSTSENAAISPVPFALVH